MSPRQFIVCKIHMKYQDISGTIYPVQVIGGHKKLMVGPLPQATRTKPSFVGFTDSSQTYLLAFCNAFLSLTTDTCHIWFFFAFKPNSVRSGFCVEQRQKNLGSRVALLPRKFFCVRKVFACIAGKKNNFKLPQYFQKDPDFST